MSFDDGFTCEFCGKYFQNDPIKLALHIKETHQESRL